MHSKFGVKGYFGKKSLKALYPKNILVSPKSNKNLRTFWLKNPAIIPIVVGKDAAHTPSLFISYSSPSSAIIKGGAQAKQADSPGIIN